MNEGTCVSCLKPKTQTICDVCHGPVCKSCAQHVSEETFAFSDVVPEMLEHRVFCRRCFDENVQPELERYDETLEAARNVLVFFKEQARETRAFSRREDFLQVKDCTDREGAILRLAFLAAKEGFNAIIDLEISSRKVRNGGYQHMLWNAKARPTKLE